MLLLPRWKCDWGMLSVYGKWHCWCYCVLLCQFSLVVTYRQYIVLYTTRPAMWCLRRLLVPHATLTMYKFRSLQNSIKVHLVVLFDWNFGLSVLANMCAMLIANGLLYFCKFVCSIHVNYLYLTGSPNKSYICQW